MGPDATTANRDRPRKRAAREPFRRRLLRPVRETARLVGMLFREPRAFPGELTAVLRAAFRTIWRARGGGLYACGFLVTFVILEVRMFAGDLAGASGVGDFLTQQVVELFLRYTVESLGNTIRAFLWPLYVAGFQPPLGLMALAALYLLFPITLKRPIERWLFDDPGAERQSSRASSGADENQE